MKRPFPHHVGRNFKESYRPAARPAPVGAKAFSSIDELLETGLQVILARMELAEGQHHAAGIAPPSRSSKWAKYWHASLEISRATNRIAARLMGSRLNRMEREIVLILLLAGLGMLTERVKTCEHVAKLLSNDPVKKLRIIRHMNDTSRLINAGFITVTGDDELLPHREIALDPTLLELALDPKTNPEAGWPVRTELECFDYFSRFAHVAVEKAGAVEQMFFGVSSDSNVFVWERRLSSLLTGLNHTLDAHPSWGLSKIRQEFQTARHRRSTSEWIVFLCLLCKEAGHIRPNSSFFEGKNLVLTAYGKEAYTKHALIHLLENGELLRERGLIQPCGGTDSFLTDTPKELEDTEFEMSQNAAEIIGLTSRAASKRKPKNELSRARIKLDDIVLPAKTRERLQWAVAQAKHARTLFDSWGLGEKIVYGRGVVMLFHGPPGTGKTATAQAISCSLDKPILIADYSRLEDCFVGQTEKNIVRLFREAREHDAVLFFDECDAMLFSRDGASRNWEARNVNILLQQLEGFEGVCILATNRAATLDAALERRIAIKIQFERPDRKARQAILRRMLPKSLPLEPDTDLDRIADAELTGGEIKNVVLNAARSALARGGSEALVSQEDFQTAIAEVKAGGLKGQSCRNIGFTAMK